jgi:hypothetical protein
LVDGFLTLVDSFLGDLSPEVGESTLLALSLLLSFSGFSGFFFGDAERDFE